MGGGVGGRIGGRGREGEVKINENLIKTKKKVASEHNRVRLKGPMEKHGKGGHGHVNEACAARNMSPEWTDTVG